MVYPTTSRPDSAESRPSRKQKRLLIIRVAAQSSRQSINQTTNSWAVMRHSVTAQNQRVKYIMHHEQETTELPSVASYHVHFASFLAWMLLTVLVAVFMRWLFGSFAMFITFGIGMPFAFLFLLRLDAVIRAAQSKKETKKTKPISQAANRTVRSIVQTGTESIVVDQKTNVSIEVWTILARYTEQTIARDWTRDKFATYARAHNVTVSGETFKKIAGELRSRSILGSTSSMAKCNASEAAAIIKFARDISAENAPPTPPIQQRKNIGQNGNYADQSRPTDSVTSGKQGMYQVLASLPLWLKIAILAAIFAAIALVYSPTIASQPAPTLQPVTFISTPTPTPTPTPTITEQQTSH